MKDKKSPPHLAVAVRVGHEISRRIANLARPTTDEQVLEVMRTHKCSALILCDAFYLLDNEPSRFPDHQTWHPRLRSLRNNPLVGEKMFALFRQGD